MAEVQRSLLAALRAFARYQWALVRRAGRETRAFIREHTLLEAVSVVLTILLLIIFGGRPRDAHEWLIALVPLIALGAVVGIVAISNLVLAPFRFHEELYALLQHLSSNQVHVSAGRPFLFREGDAQYLVVPRLTIVNRDDDPVDIDIDLSLRLRDSYKMMNPIEATTTPGLMASLDRMQRGGEQLLHPVRVDGKGRRFGYVAAYLPVEITPTDLQMAQVETVTMFVSNAISKLPIQTEELWPANWRSDLDMASIPLGGEP